MTASIATNKPVSDRSTSAAMREALALVPDDWAKPQLRFRLKSRSGRIDHPLLDRTFKALQKRGLIEWRGGPGQWQWRRTPAAMAA
jgi:hypothetical protein